MALALWMILTLIPMSIAPLFDFYTPMAPGDLRLKIENLAIELKFPLKQVHVIDDSALFAYNSIFFYGSPQAQHVVMYKKFLSHYQENEILAFLAHEIGHWQNSHSIKLQVVIQANLALSVFVFYSMFYSPLLYKAVGFEDQQPAIVGVVIVLQYILIPFNHIVLFFINFLTRRFEAEADAFVVKNGGGNDLIEGILRQNENNMIFPVHDPLYSWWNYAYPPYLERIEAINKSQ